MSNDPSKSLLPNGLRDVLPPESTREAAILGALMDRFRASAYRRVDPPLVEFEDSLLAGAGDATAPHTFRLMDPVSQRMMGIRADMTTQVARIASARLGKVPRPLRLCYAGPILRVRGTQLSPERQVTQAGCELIGSDAPESDAELIDLAADALQRVGVANLTIDISLPTIVPTILGGMGLGETERSAIQQALDRKDARAIALAGGEPGRQLSGLLAATGPAETALAQLQMLDLPKDAMDQIAHLGRVVELLAARQPELVITIDPVEYRGFEYHSGLSFTVFARGIRGDIGRGGRYVAHGGECGMGFSLYLDAVLRAAPAAQDPVMLYLPYGTEPERAAALRENGWCTLSGLAPESDSQLDTQSEARRLGCTHCWDTDSAQIIALTQN